MVFGRIMYRGLGFYLFCIGASGTLVFLGRKDEIGRASSDGSSPIAGSLNTRSNGQSQVARNMPGARRIRDSDGGGYPKPNDTSPEAGKFGQLDRIGRRCADLIARQGDYYSVKELLDEVDEKDECSIVITWIAGQSSPVGVDHDVKGQLACAQRLRPSLRQLAERRVYLGMGGRLDELESSQLIETIDAASFSWVCRGAAEIGFDAALRAMTLDAPAQSVDAGIRAGIQHLLGIDSVGTGESLLAMESGRMRDVAIAESVNWLVERSSAEEAAILAERIEDESIRNAAKMAAGAIR